MQELWTALASTDLAQWMSRARWGYAAVNTGHVLGIALLVGSIVPLDLRLIGVWPSMPLDRLARVLAPVAAGGLVLALVCGGLLFLSAPSEYAATPLFRLKMALVAVGSLAAVVFAFRPMALASVAERRFVGLVSLACWVPALVLGRFVAFAMD